MRRIEIAINLSESTSADYFDPLSNNIIHRLEFDKASAFIEELINDAVNDIQNPSHSINDTERKHFHKAVSIFGMRGSGKSSFLLTLRKKITSDSRVVLLRMIDPTLIEDKGHIFLNVIATISELVEKKLDEIESNPKSDGIHFRRNWKNKMLKLAAGLPSIEGVGSQNMEQWQDPEFVMETGLKAVKSSMRLEDDFRDLIELGLKILEKRVFLLTFDDIDVDSSKGIDVLETIRKYITGTRIITILSGDIDLYSTAVRQKKWKNFGEEILRYEGTDHKQPYQKNDNLKYFIDKITELSGQYLMKVVQPKYRIHLNTLGSKKTIFKENYRLNISYSSNSQSYELERMYSRIFQWYGIANPIQEEVYRSFMLHQPLRSQIQFLLLNKYIFENDTPLSDNNISDIFLADLLEKNVDVTLANNSVKFIHAITLRLLLKEKRLIDLYQLQPASTDNSLNASLFSLNILISNYINQGNSFLIFDYFIRIGYLRNLITTIPHKNLDFLNREYIVPTIEDACDKTGILNDNVLRDVTGHLLGYLYGSLQYENEPKSVTHSFIKLSALQSFAKRTHTDRLDSVFLHPKITSAERMLGFIPSFSGTYSYKNESKLTYSVYMVIAAIGEIVKRFNLEGYKISNRKDEIAFTKNTLKELSQLRTYPIPAFSKNHTEIENFSNNIFIEKSESDKSEDELAEQIFIWLKDFRNLNSVSPHLLGKISTRFYFALDNIAKRPSPQVLLGDLFHNQIVAFMNAVLIEDVKENMNDWISELNIDNVNTSDSVFINNISKILRNDLIYKDRHKLNLSKWLLGCPLLRAYLDSGKKAINEKNRSIFSLLTKYSMDKVNDLREEISITHILNRVRMYKQDQFAEFSSNEDLVEIFKENYIPFEWFLKGGPAVTRRNNENIIQSTQAFGKDERAKKLIRDFRDYVEKNNIRW